MSSPEEASSVGVEQVGLLNQLPVVVAGVDELVAGNAELLQSEYPDLETTAGTAPAVLRPGGRPTRPSWAGGPMSWT